jgi:putative aminopeptidase FrvX
MKLTLGILIAAAAALPAQPTPAREHPLAGWLQLDAPPGDETRATDAIMATDNRWQRDALGNLVLVARSGRPGPRRLVACGIDSPGFVVSQITEDGYLRLHRTGNRLPHPLFDQFHEGQQIKVLTRLGEARGVVAIANGHFARQHRGDTNIVNVDQLWVDVGATSRADVERLGVALLDPVRRDVPPWSFAGNIAAPDAGARAGCASVAAAARGAPADGETVFVISVSRTFNWMGLGAAAARLGRFDEIIVVEPPDSDASDQAVSRRRRARFANLPASIGVDSITALSVRARFAGTLVETVDTADAVALRVLVHQVAGVQDQGWLALRPLARVSAAQRSDSLDAYATLLVSLADLPGVSGSEWRVREAIRAKLPAWAQSRLRVDSLGNMILAVGPDRDTAMFIAHMDEVGYTVRGISGDGMVTLAPQGGVIPSAWEGQPALLDFQTASSDTNVQPLRGVFVPRDSATRKQMRGMQAWFGLDSARLVAVGVRPGLGVSAYKRATRLADTRFTGRAMDDRVGCAALILAARQLDPARLTRKVVFVWAVREEGGLIGARAVARAMGTTLRRVYAVDTFVSSDTPLESPHFAFALLGAGPVLRGLDDGIIAPRAERERVLRIARDAGIALQVGTTHGSTDATAIVPFGAPGMGLSWPGRYSHSPAEVMDLRDLSRLSRLIALVAVN